MLNNPIPLLIPKEELSPTLWGKSQGKFIQGQG